MANAAGATEDSDLGSLQLTVSVIQPESRSAEAFEIAEESSPAENAYLTGRGRESSPLRRLKDLASE